MRWATTLAVLTLVIASAPSPASSPAVDPDPTSSCGPTAEQGPCGGGATSRNSIGGADLLSDRSSDEPEDPVDPDIPTLRYATLKTGFRAVVTWTTEEPSVGELTWTLPGQAPTTVTEPTPREDHAFVLLHLPRGAELTFTARYSVPEAAGGDEVTVESQVHTFQLRNVDRHEVPARGYHTVNLTVVANQNLVDRATLEAGLDHFADLIWDATDGRVAVANLTLLYDAPHATEAGVACVATPRSPACHHLADVTFGYANIPYHRGTTVLGGIEETHEAIYMNNLWESLVWGFPQEIGSVLAHELGHYAFFMDEAYGSDDCYDPETEVSVMGTDRRATEFDGPTAPCPEGQPGEQSWTSLRAHYEGVRERSGGPDPGPDGAGPAYELTVLDFSGDGSPPTSDRSPVVVDASGDARCHEAHCAALAPRGNASGGVLAVSQTGQADGGTAVSGTDDARGGAALSGAGNASGGTAASATGDARGFVAASGAGDASGGTAATGTGDASGANAVAGTGNATATGGLAVSGTGDAASCYAPDGTIWLNCVAVSATGDAEADFLAVSGTGNSTAQHTALSGCETTRDRTGSDVACRDVDPGTSSP